MADFTEAEARRAIEEPVKAVGGAFEKGLVEVLLNDLRNGHTGIEPIALQIVCHTLWQDKAENQSQITFVDYKARGGAERMLREHIICLLSRIPLHQQGLLVRILEALKTSDGTKRYLTFEDLKSNLRLRREPPLKRMLDMLVRHNLLRREQRGGTDWYEFKHDRLVEKITD